MTVKSTSPLNVKITSLKLLLFNTTCSTNAIQHSRSFELDRHSLCFIPQAKDLTAQFILVVLYDFTLRRKRSTALYSFSGVIDISGGSRGILEFKASLLASHGFATLALGYFKLDAMASSVPPFIELEYFEEAAEWLIRHPKICSDGLGINSNCMGSWIALLLASYRSDLFRGVVAITPWHAAIFVPYKYRGKRSDCIGFCKGSIVSTDEGNIYRYAYSAAKAAEVIQVGAEIPATTPVENISCPVLLAYGTNDLLIDADHQAFYISEQMKKVGKGDLCSVLRLPNAGHLIEPPYAPLCATSYYPTLGEHVLWGGETKAHAIASEVAWKETLGFLNQTLSSNT